MPNLASDIQGALSTRFGERLEIDAGLPGLDELARIAAHRVHRRYQAREVSSELLRGPFRRRRKATSSRRTFSS